MDFNLSEDDLEFKKMARDFAEKRLYPRAEEFDESIRRYLPGVTALVLPLVPAPGELIGLVVLYRKGEQPFLDDDVALAEVVGHPTAIAVRRND